jgi:molecular chaperone GrpE (heat shock protein)
MTKEKEEVKEEKEEKKEEVEEQAEPASETPAKPETVEEPKEEPVDELTEATDKVAELEKRLEEVLGQVDSKASAEVELKKIYLDKIPETIHKDVDDLDLTTLKAFAKLSDHFQSQIEDTTRLEEAPVINETDRVGLDDGFNDDGSMNDKLFYSLKIKHAKANGMKYPEEWNKYLTV